MADASSTYVGICAGAGILVSPLPLPEALVDDCRLARVYPIHRLTIQKSKAGVATLWHRR